MEPDPDECDVPDSLQAKIGDCALYQGGRRVPGMVPLAKAGNIARTAEGFVWIGLQQPTGADIALVAKEFDLPARRRGCRQGPPASQVGDLRRRGLRRAQAGAVHRS